MTTRYGGQDRVSTKSKLAAEMAILGRVLVTVRERAGLKQTDVAARLALPASYLSKVENGTRRLDVIELVHICQAMDVDPAAVMSELVEALQGEQH
jgi:transcriptional regulator with XRE-family HTH domain